ncbi:tetratricopeptide repeat protein [uncultured Treponema sp.]|uniref:tetratricopeptide repeat protein n=1 Tax=uncultured Treponema sp. TaxID=162155 RepID=UPI0025EE6990|nr:tetratricopeptide repeat protein [uncultured Treponema sp.]
MKLTRFKSLFIITACSAFLAACTTIPKEIPEELTAQELIQKGQTEFENGHYQAAICYYNAVTERYADSPPLYLEAYYEIGHLYMRQKKYSKAEPIFQDILDLYANSQPGTLPGSYQKLAQLEMDKIKEKK